MLTHIRIATRKSPLALWQANFVKSELQAAHPHLQVDLVAMSTQGDHLLDTSLAKVGGKGLFVKELETALLEGNADIAVHSIKDVPMELPAGLHLPIICRRADPRDALVSNQYDNLDALPGGSRVGTSSLRRQCQLLHYRPDVEVITLRGNVNTRLQKLDNDQYDAIILACAGLARLNLQHRITQHIDCTTCLPAVGQGAIGIEARTDDHLVENLLRPLHDVATAEQILAERAMNKQLQGGCQVPIAGYATTDPNNDQQLWLRARVGSPDGKQLLYSERYAARSEAQALGIAVAEDLLTQGADVILRRVYGLETGN